MSGVRVVKAGNIPVPVGRGQEAASATQPSCESALGEVENEVHMWSPKRFHRVAATVTPTPVEDCAVLLHPRTHHLGLTPLTVNFADVIINLAHS
ncbi:hypothetical protein ACIBCN_28675 [Nocardia sp. NPDC051052]|uniref:hypothetical protein n=1 Tax=Nocardia sp. NPDC051052 TaxID=3364322 RepID=UPI0037B71BC3